MRILLLLAAAAGFITAETHKVYPDRFYDTFSFAHEPVARIKPGDKVITTLLDSRGHDKNGKLIIYADNVLTGPFYIEGAEAGDTLIVRFDKVRLNRDWGWNGVRVGIGALTPSYVENVYDNNYLEEWLQPGRRNALKWRLDVQRLVGSPSAPLGNKVKMEYPLRPAIGCAGVAPPNKTVETSGPTGPHGGNIDYNGLGEGTVLYLNVFEPGALFFIGDGHGTHGDGELLGNGTETSLDVDFTVDLIKKNRIGGPRLEEPEHLVSFGLRPNDMKESFQFAITDMIQWLTTEYAMTPQEAHVMLGMEAELRVAAWGNTMLCRLSKKRLPPRLPAKAVAGAISLAP